MKKNSDYCFTNKNTTNRRQYFDWLAGEMGISANSGPEQWYHLSGSDVTERQGGGLLVYHNYSLVSALEGMWYLIAFLSLPSPLSLPSLISVHSVSLLLFCSTTAAFPEYEWLPW